MKLVLVRHGNTFEKSETPRFVGAKTDLPLTEQGKKQAEALADYFRKENIAPTLIFHSSLKRQVETASIIAKRIGVANLIETKDLCEIDYGPWENLSSEEIKFMWPDEFVKWNEQGIWPSNIFPLKEEDLKATLDRWLKNVESQFLDQTVMAVSSNGVLRIIKSLIEKDNYKFKGSKVRTGAICIIEMQNGRRDIIKWDYQP